MLSPRKLRFSLRSSSRPGSPRRSSSRSPARSRVAAPQQQDTVEGLEDDRAAARIQAIYRGRFARKSKANTAAVDGSHEDHRAATAIQARIRARGARMLTRRAKAEREETHGAAVRLQSRYRGKMTRQNTMLVGQAATKNLSALVNSSPGLASSALNSIARGVHGVAHLDFSGTPPLLNPNPARLRLRVHTDILVSSQQS
jgi:hypothetical protein